MTQTKLNFKGWSIWEQYSRAIDNTQDMYIRYLLEDYDKQKNARKEQELQRDKQESL